MEFMNSVLIVGSGGREHAIVKALLRSNQPMCIYAHPGNPGMENDGCMLVDSPIKNWEDLAVWAQKNHIDLTIVGPEQPLVEGIVDVFSKKGLAIFGPTKAAAQIEGSKLFSKQLMQKYKIPTAAFKSFTNKSSAMAYLKKKGAPIVVKASGLAAGKGAYVCHTNAEAEAALIDIFDKKTFGDAGNTVVLEEMMSGEEASIFVLTDGKDHRILPIAQDHKRIGDNDTGPNTGGMGAYAPAPLVDSAMLATIDKNIIIPTLDAMKQEKCTYTGLLYVGIMATPEGPKVVEYNCRFGDPETQAVLPLVESDWYDIFSACTKGELATLKWTIKKASCIAIILASDGYPGAYKKGMVIHGSEEVEQSQPNIDIYHAGTVRDADGNLVTNGGRVLALTVWEPTLAGAIATAYNVIDGVSFTGMKYRRDIGAKGLKRS